VWTAVSAVQEQARCLPDKTWIHKILIP